jgi:hypothetical protein
MLFWSTSEFDNFDEVPALLRQGRAVETRQLSEVGH